MADLSVPNPTGQEKATSPIRYMDTVEAYNRWSEVYDTDGNFLQALDTIEIGKGLPAFLSLIHSDQPYKIVDLGCGTGRGTLLLLTKLKAPFTVVGLDASSKMLDIARTRIDAKRNGLEGDLRPMIVQLKVWDVLGRSSCPTSALGADAVISTLVIEHLPLDKFFEAAKNILKQGGMLLVTNMHSEMGKISQAGFVDPKTGEKVRPTSYIHTVDDVLQEATRKGFEQVGNMKEKAVNEEMVASLGERARKWVGVTVWFEVCFRKVVR